MRNQNNKTAKKGFTLIELLIVIGILGILAAIVLVAVDPAKRLQQSRNARRSSEVNAILNAILNYTVDNLGTIPSAIDSSATDVQQLGASLSVCEAGCSAGSPGGPSLFTCADLSGDLVDEYIAEMPIDPKGDNGSGVTFSATRTGYYVNKTGNGRIEVGSCAAELSATIKIKR